MEYILAPVLTFSVIGEPECIFGAICHLGCACVLFLWQAVQGFLDQLLLSVYFLAVNIYSS